LDSLREGVNYSIDAAAATLQRLLELPLIGVFAIGVIAACGVLLLARLLSRRVPRPRTTLGLRIAAVLLVVAPLLLAIDRRLQSEERYRDSEHERATTAALGLLEELQAHGIPRAHLRIDLDQVREAVCASFPTLTLRGVVLDELTDLVLLRGRDPLLSGALAIFDLTNPDLRLDLDADFTSKTMTSAFGSRHRCSVAINGEAGMSPRPGCGLGKWRGNMVIDGQCLIREFPEQPLPFLCFDATNRARFVAADARERAMRTEDRNVIPGRADVVVGGVPSTASYRFNQPRTAMGIDRDGKRLFLLVVDGRQPNRSVGLTLPEAAVLLSAFGIWDAMLCDDGGSSCMYVGAMQGLITKPSDNHGEERPTYTHFGIGDRRTPGR
jgi:hypothetical protein